MSTRVNVFATAGAALLLASGAGYASQATAVKDDASQTTQGQLTVRSIMRGTDFVGTAPRRLRWSPDGDWLYFVWKEPGAEREGLYRVKTRGGSPERLSDEEALELAPRLEAVLSKDRRYGAYADNGDLYLLDVRADKASRLISQQGRISSVQISGDGSSVYFVTEHNLFRVGTADGSVQQLTDIRRGKKPEEKEPEGQRKFLRDEQRLLLDVFEQDSIRRARRWPPPTDTAKVDTPQAFYLKDGESANGFHVSPDGRRMVIAIEKEAKEARRAWVPDYVTEGGYTKQAPQKRTLVGDAQSDDRLGVIDLVSGEVMTVDHGQGDRAVNLGFREWSDDGRRFVAVGIAHDFHDRWILVVDALTGESRVIDELHDDAWIGGPALGSAGWLGADRVWFVSEQSGFAHIYTRAVGGGDVAPVTSGPWEVIDVSLSEDKQEFYLVTSEASPHVRHFYRAPLGGGQREQITSGMSLHGGAGRNVSSVAISPDEKRLAVVKAASNRPPELFLQENREGANATTITSSTTAEFESRAWMQPEIVYVPARDGEEVPARLYRPGRPNGAGVIFVHGAGYLQNVHRWWSIYYREYMFHNLLVERGYTVLDIDYRGSAGYGRDWRTAISKHMGDKDLSDQIDGARYLVESHGIDPARIGIYGGSYGGFITLMAMFTEPGVFAAGAALRPVTDWAYYNHWYTSRILGLPQDDAEAYRRSSPIYHAEGLEGALLMAHGMIDQNVHFQDVVRLAQRLIELGKENWEVAIYPKEDHGFVHASSWSDEYRRILELFDSNLLGSGTRTPPEASSN